MNSLGLGLASLGRKVAVLGRSHEPFADHGGRRGTEDDLYGLVLTGLTIIDGDGRADRLER